MSEAEWLTRKKRIDTRLRGMTPPWKIIRYQDGLDLSALHCAAIEEFPTANGPADYALFVNGTLLGIIEAKKVTVNPQNVLEQAKRYAAGATTGPGNWNGLRVPFLYATNGEIIWHLDTRADKPASRTIANFHTALALAEKFAFDDRPSRHWLLDTPPEKITRLRPYQVASIVATEAAMLAGRRELLIAMATGTGKTFLTVAQIYRLLESKKFKRILFLVDRKALAAQAVRTFNAFDTSQGNKLTQEYEVYSQKFQREDFGDDEPFDPKVLPNEYLTNPNSTHTFVYVSTIQRMARNLFGAEGCFPQTNGDADYEETGYGLAKTREPVLPLLEERAGVRTVVSPTSDADADKLDIPIHAFDLIIADECHRGYTLQETSLWRDTLTPYSQGVKANVIFLQKGKPTENVWIFNARSNVPGITKKDRPLTAAHFEEFEKAYGKDPNGLSKRTDGGETGRFRKFHVSDIKERGYKLDVTWLKDDSLEDSDELPEPQDLASEAITELESVVDDLREIITLLEKEEGVEK